MLPSNCTRVAFDVGTNTGKDMLAFAKRGLCVVAVDANPVMASQAAEAAADYFPNVRVLNYGLVEKATGDNISFYVTRSLIHSSFEEAKARRHLQPGESLRTIMVPSASCKVLWLYLPNNSRLLYMKVDIEERHHVCIEALAQVLPARLPRYISWEMHEYARGLPYPLLDVDLLIQMYRRGYEHIKVAGNRWFGGGGSFSGGLLPEEVVSYATNSSKWESVSTVLARGLGWPREQKPLPNWWDYHLKLSRLRGQQDDQQTAEIEHFVERSRARLHMSWSMHTFANSRLPFPLSHLDVMLRLFRVGYKVSKVSVTWPRHASIGDRAEGVVERIHPNHPSERAVDLVTNRTQWLPVEVVFARGLRPSPGSVRAPWTFHMRRTSWTAQIMDGSRTAPLPRPTRALSRPGGTH